MTAIEKIEAASRLEAATKTFQGAIEEAFEDGVFSPATVAALEIAWDAGARVRHALAYREGL